MHAVRNINLCTKDCLCLYVCPTGATDTETGQIDATKCISGCRACVDSCPSHAISLVPDEYPSQQEKNSSVIKEMLNLSQSKLQQEMIAGSIVENSKDPIKKQLAKAIMMSNKIMGEDILRESGYMLPQSENVIKLLERLKESKDNELPKEVIDRLILLLAPFDNKH